ncbi:MAG: tRNA uridine-5-carboxymethylaminomethyl(34) synthesis GTPase MnmE [Candidatus Aminicenantales bacterium]
MLEDTIIAVSTPLGYGGLGVVRLSGARALPIARKIFRPLKDLRKIPPRRPVLGHLIDPGSGDPFEEAYLTFFASPWTYTREDIVEISCHGSPIILEEVVRLGVSQGARLAHPGEFTLRAYLNGRIDIIQAEAVNDIIMASSLKQARISFHQLEGSLSRTVSQMRTQIIRLLSQVEAAIEFPDENLQISRRSLSKACERTSQTLEKLVSSYDLGKVLTGGFSLVITGRANVGKSTLFNALLEKDRAIVTPYPGTTRDYLQEKVRIKDALFTLTDMAGIGTPSHPAEKEGVRRGKKMAAAGDGILLVLDASRKETREDKQLLKKYRSKPMVLVFNKTDLPVKMDIPGFKNLAQGRPCLEISALKRVNLERLKTLIYRHFVPQEKDYAEVILHLRQKLLLKDVLSCLEQAKTRLEEGCSEEIFAEELRKALPLVGQLTGEVRMDDVLEDVFSRFCVGK